MQAGLKGSNMAWTEIKDRRRYILIERLIDNVLSWKERLELDSLQYEMTIHRCRNILKFPSRETLGSYKDQRIEG